MVEGDWMRVGSNKKSLGRMNCRGFFYWLTPLGNQDFFFLFSAS